MSNKKSSDVFSSVLLSIIMLVLAALVCGMAIRVFAWAAGF